MGVYVGEFVGVGVWVVFGWLYGSGGGRISHGISEREAATSVCMCVHAYVVLVCGCAWVCMFARAHVCV